MGTAADRIVKLATETVFNRPLIVNVFRSAIVEAIVADTLPDWRWCSTDYAAYDFIHPDGTRLEVKQTALRQSWKTVSPPKPSWDIRARTGMWEDGTKWIPGVARNAEIYVLALHPVIDDSADHRDPDQWEFYVIRETLLPATQRLSLLRAKELASPTRIGGFHDEVQRARQKVKGEG